MISAGQRGALHRGGPTSAPTSVPEDLRSAVQRSAHRSDAQAPSPHEQALLRALDQALAHRPASGTIEPFTLDLSALEPPALALFTEEVARTLDRPEGHEHGAVRPVTRLMLPEGASSLPTGVRGLPDLQELSSPGFAGVQLDLRRLLLGRTATPTALRISTPGAATLREIQVDSTSLAARHWRFDLRTLHARKVTLVDSAHRRPVPGQVYIREATGRHARDSKEAEQAFEHLSRVALNGQVTFRDSAEPIMCRHLAIDHARRMWEHRRLPPPPGGGARPRLDYKALSATEPLQAVMPTDLEARFDDFTRRSRENHLVAVPRWDDFLRSQLSAIKPGQDRQFLVLSYNHVMHLELQVKPRPGDARDTDWVVTFYDPNRTATHRRVVLDPSPDRPCTLVSLLPTEQRLADYFGSDPTQGVALLMRAADDTFDSHNPVSGEAQARPLRTDCAGDLCSAQELFLRLMFGLHAGLIPRLHTTLGDSRISSSDLLALLQAKDEDGTPALFMALQQGHEEAAHVVLGAALQAAAAGRIAPPGLRTLLQAQDKDGNPALFMALQNGHAPAAKVLLDAALQAADRGYIDSHVLLDLLVPESEDGTPALCVALQNGHADTAKALLRAALQAADEGHIDDQSLLVLLQAKAGDGPALFMALQNGHAPAAQVLLDAALQAATAGRIGRHDLLELLQAEDPRGIPALSMAMQGGRAPAAQALLDVSLRAAAAGRIDRAGLMALLQAKRADGIPALWMALQQGHPDAAQALFDAFTTAIDRGCIEPGVLMTLLQAPDSGGATSLSEALRTNPSGGALQLLAALAQWIARSPKGGTALAPAQLEGWLREAGTALAEALRAPGPSGASVASPGPHLLDSLDVWIKAVLDSPLPPPAKAALLFKHKIGDESLVAYLAARPAHAKKHLDTVRELIAALLPLAADRKSGPLPPAAPAGAGSRVQAGPADR